MTSSNGIQPQNDSPQSDLLKEPPKSNLQAPSPKPKKRPLPPLSHSSPVSIASLSQTGLHLPAPPSKNSSSEKPNKIPNESNIISARQKFLKPPNEHLFTPVKISGSKQTEDSGGQSKQSEDSGGQFKLSEDFGGQSKQTTKFETEITKLNAKNKTLTSEIQSFIPGFQSHSPSKQEIEAPRANLVKLSESVTTIKDSFGNRLQEISEGLNRVEAEMNGIFFKCLSDKERLVQAAYRDWSCAPASSFRSVSSVIPTGIDLPSFSIFDNLNTPKTPFFAAVKPIGIHMDHNEFANKSDTQTKPSPVVDNTNNVNVYYSQKQHLTTLFSSPACFWEDKSNRNFESYVITKFNNSGWTRPQDKASVSLGTKITKGSNQSQNEKAVTFLPLKESSTIKENISNPLLLARKR